MRPRSVKSHLLSVRFQYHWMMLLMCSILGFWGTLPALAQQETPDFATIRKTELAIIDRNNVQNWINQEVSALLSTQNSDQVKAMGQAFLTTIRTHFVARDATSEFKTGLSQLLATAINNQFQPAAQGEGVPHPLGNAYALMALNVVIRPNDEVVGAYQKVLNTARTAAARYLAARGLLQVRDQLSAAQWSNLLPAIRQAAVQEHNPVAMDQIYDLLAVSQGERVTTTAPVVLTILTDRTEEYAKTAAWPLPADARAARWLADRMNTINNTDLENRTALQAARLMTQATYAFVSRKGERTGAQDPDGTGGPPKLTREQQERLERVVHHSEQALLVILRRKNNIQPPAPTVTQGILKAANDGNPPIMLALNKWIGTEQDEGVLNRAPFNFPRGLGLERPEGVPVPLPEESTTASN